MSIEIREARPGRQGVVYSSFLLACSVALAVLQACQASQAAAPATEENAVGSTSGDPRKSEEGLRTYIAQQVGGLDKLTVPPDDAAIPLPPDDPTRPGRYRTTEPKRFLGKMLFHDPVRTARINVNEGVPFDLP